MPTTATKPSTKPSTFIARAVDLRIVVQAEDVISDQRGKIVERIKGESIDFENNRFVAEPDHVLEGEDGRVHVADFLRDHPNFNVDFWEIGNAPNEPKPTFAEQNAKIIRALGARDTDALAAVVEEENATHKREGVLDAAEVALSELAGESD